MAEQKPKFEVLYSEEADAFLAEQSDKVRAKILYNVQKASYTNDPKLFKKLENTDIWEFPHCLIIFNTAYWHFGISETAKIQILHAQSIKDIYFNQTK